MGNNYYVDMHCHPAVKPYSWSKIKGTHSVKDRKDKTSLWMQDPPKGCDKPLNRWLSLTRFRQSDFTTLTEGNVRIISACLNPIERGLFTVRWPFKFIGKILLRFIMLVGYKYIELVKKEKRSYFEALQEEYSFYLQEEGPQGEDQRQYRLTRNFHEIQENLEASNIISVFFSIEGCHVFNNSGLKPCFPEEKVIENIRKVKKWKYRPLYVSIAHHMNNDLCGHAKSLTPLIEKFIDQNKGLDAGFTCLGKKVLEILLEKEGRIYIDVKHMSARSRYEYYKILDTKYKGVPIPVLVSHGAVNDRASLEDAVYCRESPEDPMDDHGSQAEDVEFEFNKGDINFFDDEIIRIRATGGFLGIQIDERRLCSAEQKKLTKRKKRCSAQLYHQAGLVWKQIQHIAEVLDKKGEFGWGTATIGSDYDGIVDPPNGFWTSKEFGKLERCLVDHAEDYFNEYSDNKLTTDSNKLKDCQDPARYVIDLFMRGNAMRFLNEFFTGDGAYENDTFCKDP